METLGEKKHAKATDGDEAGVQPDVKKGDKGSHL